ncbi:CRISPR-associated endoribonuclease Cas6 [Fibrella aquatilis]|uniref:CRISPR-associated endoribonuclease Cas6 n=1 Tax=Fibrella aquatilis TaxID=2817059 RepID=A0A939K036_9BACT|nr:CRISPR-associated endoribonuclease Cas6 [Fibrella aquatilis]MBO0932063.1 CRISPR-associated endoribonuclease Cas6 [Fibrella aquatilis]
MQFTLRLLATESSARIPFNYQYLLTGWLYRVLADADGDYARFLHERGYQVASGTWSRKTFKLFTFSDLRMHGYEVRPKEGCFVLTSPVVDWTLSFYVEQAAEAFIMGLFQDQHLTLVNRHFQTELAVERVETLALPSLTDTLTLRTLSPIVVAQKDNTGMDQYLHPYDDAFGPLLLINLIDKYRSTRIDANFDTDEPNLKNFSFEPLTKPDRLRSRLVTIKEGSPQETKVRGWHSLDFRLHGPAEVLEAGFLAGLGRYNAEGFGCVGARG